MNGNNVFRPFNIDNSPTRICQIPGHDFIKNLLCPYLSPVFLLDFESRPIGDFNFPSVFTDHRPLFRSLHYSRVSNNQKASALIYNFAINPHNCQKLTQMFDFLEENCAFINITPMCLF